MQQTQEYGSINKSENDEEATGGNYDREYDLNNTYYLGEEKGIKVKRLLIGCFPVLIAVLVVGGIMYVLQQHFNFFYPSAGGGSGKSSGGGGSFQPTFDEPTSSVDDSSSSSLCIENVGCEDLSGYCCPTADGIFLACCN